MSGSIGSRILSTVAVAVLLLTAVCAFRFNEPQFKAYREAMEHRARLQSENAAKNEELSELRRDQDRFVHDEEFVIRVARENRKLFPGEILFTFPTPDDK